MSLVYFTSDKKKAGDLFDAAGFKEIISPNDLVALKIHFGEPGNTSVLRPDETKPIFDKIVELKGKPFYTDCNTLYRGRRSQTESHLEVAIERGFQDSIIPQESDFAEILVNLKHFKKVQIGGAGARANSIIALTHFKGHELTGFGGTLKNLGMGFGTRLGKLKMHQDCKNCPEVKKCRRNQTIEACWMGGSEIVQEKMVEYAFGAVKNKKCAYFNFIVRVSPNCDCFPQNDAPLVPDVGVAASFDPVALDQASADLINKERDEFKAVYPDIDWNIQLNYARQIGLGSRQYELVLK